MQRLPDLFEKKTLKNLFFLQKSWFANGTYIQTPIKGAHSVQGGS